MKVLFVSSGNSANGIGVIVKNQGETLRKIGIDLSYFTIKGKGLTGYLRNIPRLAGYIRKNDFDIVHAHYSLSAFVATLSTRKPVVASLMGSDIRVKRSMNRLIRIFSGYFWAATIVKSDRMKAELKLKNAAVIPNGVDLTQFTHVPQAEAQEKVAFDPSHKHIVFVSDPVRQEKNFNLARESFNNLHYNKEVELHAIHGVEHSLIRYYLHAADVLLLTSLWEGSPNIIKEALACNLPIVATDVGDIRENIENVEGCFLAGYNPQDVGSRLISALDFNKRTNGRKIIEERMNAQLIALKIRDLYSQALLSNNNSGKK